MTELVTIERSNVKITETAWTPSRDLDFDEWVEEGERLVRINRAVQWWVGDWLRYGEHRYQHKYLDAADATGFDEQTLKNMQWVATVFEPDRRRESLSWSHHREVAGLDVEQQDALLGLAEAKDWSRRHLASAANGNGHKSPRGDSSKTSRLTFEQTFPNEQRQRTLNAELRKAAESLGFTEKKAAA